MITDDRSNIKGEPTGWSTITLEGGPYSGQTMHLPDDQADIELYDGPAAHRYYRATRGARFVHWTKIAAMFGGGR